MKKALYSLITQPKTYLYVLTTCITLFAFFVTVIQFSNIVNVLALDIGFGQKMQAFFSFYISPFDTFSEESLVLFILSTVVLGFQFSLMRMYAQRMVITKNTSLSFVGVLSVLLGCLACCSSIVFASSAAVLGVTAQTFLPMQGKEFGYIGLGIAVLSFLFTLLKYTKPQTC